VAKYKKCPRCELNYILEDVDYCDVCKAEMKIIADDSFEDDMELCPVCGQNFVSVDQVMCDICAKKRTLDDVVDESENDQEEKKPREDWDTESEELDKIESTPIEDSVDDEIDVVNFSDLDEEDDDDDYVDDDDDSGVDHFEDDDFDYLDIDDDFDDEEDDEEEDDDDFDDIPPMKR